MMNLFTMPNGTVVNLFKALYVTAPIHRVLQNRFEIEILFEGQPEPYLFSLSYHELNEGVDAARYKAASIHREIIERWAE